jgi:fimbrial chaperone protein
MKKRYLIPFLAMAAAGSANAGYSVSPLGRINPDTTQTDVITVINITNAETKIQVRTFAWTQVDGKDVLTPTREIMATPGMLSLKAGEKKVVRLMRMKPVTGKEMDYRLLINEVPGPRDPSEKRMGARVFVESNLPWIYQPAGVATNVSASYRGKEIVFSNTGTAAAQIAKLGPVGGKLWIPGLAGWVLPGSALSFPVPDKATTVAVMVNGKAQTLSVK